MHSKTFRTGRPPISRTWYASSEDPQAIHKPVSSFDMAPMPQLNMLRANTPGPVFSRQKFRRPDPPAYVPPALTAAPASDSGHPDDWRFQLLKVLSVRGVEYAFADLHALVRRVRSNNMVYRCPWVMPVFRSFHSRCRHYLFPLRFWYALSPTAQGRACQPNAQAGRLKAAVFADNRIAAFLACFFNPQLI